MLIKGVTAVMASIKAVHASAPLPGQMSKNQRKRASTFFAPLCQPDRVFEYEG